MARPPEGHDPRGTPATESSECVVGERWSKHCKFIRSAAAGRGVALRPREQRGA